MWRPAEPSVTEQVNRHFDMDSSTSNLLSLYLQGEERFNDDWRSRFQGAVVQNKIKRKAHIHGALPNVSDCHTSLFTTPMETKT